MIFLLKSTMIIYGYLFISDIHILTLSRLITNSTQLIHRHSSQKMFNSLNRRSSFNYLQGLGSIMDSNISMGILWGLPLILTIKLSQEEISMNYMCDFQKLCYLALWCSLKAPTQERYLIYVKDLAKSQSRVFFWEMQKSRCICVLGINKSRSRRMWSALEKTIGNNLSFKERIIWR